MSHHTTLHVMTCSQHATLTSHLLLPSCVYMKDFMYCPPLTLPLSSPSPLPLLPSLSLFSLSPSPPLSLSPHLQTSFKDSKLQQINGIAFILIFFIVRVLSIPFMYWLYANQHHNGDLLRAVQEMRWYCHGSAWAMFLIQLIWFGAAFSKVLRGARRLYSGSSTISSNKKES